MIVFINMSEKIRYSKNYILTESQFEKIIDDNKAENMVLKYLNSLTLSVDKGKDGNITIIDDTNGKPIFMYRIWFYELNPEIIFKTLYIDDDLVTKIQNFFGYESLVYLINWFNKKYDKNLKLPDFEWMSQSEEWRAYHDGWEYGDEEYMMEEIEPSDLAVKNICDSEKFCSAQGKITFGQLKAIVESATKKRLFINVGEGGFKATIRLLPWFLPQISLAGFLSSGLRAANKIFRPTLTETTNYKTWWGRAVMKAFDMVEGDLKINDPFSRIFFISDGLMTMLNDRYKIKFARHISELASQMPESEEVPEFFVENELRKWLNEKFLLDPPLPTRNDKVVKQIMEQFNSDKLYSKNYIVQMLRSGPKELKTFIKKLPDIPCTNNKGEDMMCTKIPEIVQVYINGKY